MKKISFLVLSLLMGFNCYSQQSKIAVGVDVFPTITFLRGNHFINNYTARFSFSAGLNIEYVINDKYSIKSGLAFERKGANTEMDYRDINGNPIQSQKININFDYLVLPILGSLSTNGKNKLYFDAGPYLGFLLSQKVVTGAVGNISDQTLDYTETTKRMDLGLSLGFGVKLPLNDRLAINCGVRGNLGLLNTSKVPVVDNGSVRTNSFGAQLSLKYKL